MTDGQPNGIEPNDNDIAILHLETSVTETYLGKKLFPNDLNMLNLATRSSTPVGKLDSIQMPLGMTARYIDADASLVLHGIYGYLLGSSGGSIFDEADTVFAVISGGAAPLPNTIIDHGATCARWKPTLDGADALPIAVPAWKLELPGD